jgi:hypothetical protein
VVIIAGRKRARLEQHPSPWEAFSKLRVSSFGTAHVIDYSFQKT